MCSSKRINSLSSMNEVRTPTPQTAGESQPNGPVYQK